VRACSSLHVRVIIHPDDERPFIPLLLLSPPLLRNFPGVPGVERGGVRVSVFLPRGGAFSLERRDTCTRVRGRA
jgi:hypothetical protein